MERFYIINIFLYNFLSNILFISYFFNTRNIIKNIYKTLIHCLK